MTVRVLDTFTAPDGTLLTGRTPDIAPAGATWFPVGPAPLPVGDILSNQARIQDIGDGSGRGYLIESEISDAEITMRFTGNSINPTFGGIKFRGTLADHWVVRVDASTNAVLLFRPNGSNADSGTLITGVNDIVDFVVTVRGVTITCLITNVGSGASITLSTSDTTNETATLHGLHSRTAFGAGVGDFFDNFQVADPPPQTEAQMEIVAFNPPTGVGTQDITHPNLAGKFPKGVVFYQIFGSPQNSGDTATWGIGAATGPANEWAMANGYENGDAENGKNWREDRCILLNRRATTVNDGEARFDSFIDGGVRIEWLNGFNAGGFFPGSGVNQRTIIAVFFAGAKMQAFATVHDMQPTPLAVPTPFKPDGVIAALCRSINPIDITTPAEGGWGWQDFLDDANPNHSLWSNQNTSDPPQATSDPISRRSNSETAAAINITTGALELCVRYTDPSISGVTARFDSGGGAFRVGAFFFRAEDAIVKVGNVAGPDKAGAYVQNDPGFRPQFVGLITTSLDSLNANPSEDMAYGYGFMTDDDEFASWGFREEGSATAVAASGHQAKAVFLRDQVATKDLFSGEFVTMFGEGFTLVFDTVESDGLNTLPPQWGYLAIGKADPAAAVEDIICEPDPWTS